MGAHSAMHHNSTYYSGNYFKDVRTILLESADYKLRNKNKQTLDAGSTSTFSASHAL